MRSWTAAALAGQKQIAARLSREGIQLVPDFVYTRTLNGFAAPIDSRALALLERDPTSWASIRCAPRTRRRSRRWSSAALPSPQGPAAGQSCPSPASRAGGSPSPCSTPGWTSRIPSSAAGCARASTCSIPRRARSPTRIRTTRPGSSATGRRWPACSPGGAGPPACAVWRPLRRSCRSASPAGSRPPPAGSRSTGAPTSCSPASSGPSTPTPTATCSTRPASPSSESWNRLRRSTTGRSRVRSRVPSDSTHSSLSHQATKVRPGPSTAASAAQAVRRPR